MFVDTSLGRTHHSRFRSSSQSSLQNRVNPSGGRYSTIIILAIIFIFAAFFRLTGRDFDQGTNQHPDERAIVDHTLGLAWPASLEPDP